MIMETPPGEVRSRHLGHMLLSIPAHNAERLFSAN